MHNGLISEKFKFKTDGKIALVVGHNDTTPQFVNAFLGNKKYPEIEDTNNSNLYIITIANNVINPLCILIKFRHFVFYDSTK